MGLLQRFNKVIDVVKDQIDAARTTTAATAPPPTATPDSGSSADPRSFISPADVAAITGIEVDDGTPARTDATSAIVFTGSGPGGICRFEVHRVDDASLSAVGGDPRRFIDARMSALADREVRDWGDYTVVGRAADHAECWSWVTDSCFGATVFLPGADERTTAEKLLRRVYDWPDS
jgi:hypothetical protein